MNEKQLKRMVHLIFEEMKKQNVVTFKVKEDQVAARALQLAKGDFARERELDEEVNRMMDDSERQNPGEFQRYKMFPLLKKRLAKEKGIIL
jgi:hypothetical protein